MSKKPTTAEAVLLVAAAIKELKDAQKAHQAAYQEAQTAYQSFKQEVMDTLTTIISRDEVHQMIAEAELDDLTLEQVQEKILKAVADKAAKQAVDEANREQDARIDELTEQLNALQSQPRLSLVTFEGEFDQYIKTPSDTMIQVSEGVYAPTYRYQRIVYVFNRNNTLLNTAIHDRLYLANYTRPKNSDAPQTSTPLPTGWRIEEGSQYVTLQEHLLFPKTTEEVQVIISHPDVEGTLTISLTH